MGDYFGKLCMKCFNLSTQKSIKLEQISFIQGSALSELNFCNNCFRFSFSLSIPLSRWLALIISGTIELLPPPIPFSSLSR